MTENDLPEFYDPIEIDKHSDKLDSYNFNSIYAFMVDPEKKTKFEIKEEGRELLDKILVCWLARILSEKLLSEVIYTVAQMHLESEKLIEKELFSGGRSANFKAISSKFLECFLNEHREEEKLEEDS